MTSQCLLRRTRRSRMPARPRNPRMPPPLLLTFAACNVQKVIIPLTIGASAYEPYSLARKEESLRKRLLIGGSQRWQSQATSQSGERAGTPTAKGSRNNRKAYPITRRKYCRVSISDPKVGPFCLGIAWHRLESPTSK